MPTPSFDGIVLKCSTLADAGMYLLGQGTCRFVICATIAFFIIHEVLPEQNRPNAAVLFPGKNAILGA
jgi:hypothetical protein